MAPAELSIRVGQALQARGWSLITAESCTGGWIAKAVTDVAGSSAWFEGGIVAYSNAAKQALLGVGASTLAAHGAVSTQTVAAMAAGALARSGADLAVAVSGIAGPGGGSDAKPVGTVWLAWARRDRPPWTRCLHLDGDRDAVRRQAVSAALEGVLDAAAG